MRILITGSTGFVGRNLIEYLQNSHILTGLNRDIDNGIKENYQWAQLLDLPDQFDIFIHLAGKAHDLKDATDEEEYVKVNFGLTKKLFGLFLLSEASTFIFLSSVKAVADVVPVILTEEVKSDPKTVYGRSKLIAEEYILNNIPANKHVYILRPCMIHGAGNKGNLNLLYKFVSKGIPYPLGAFENQRSFLSVENLCFVIKKLMENDSISSGIYNVADDEPVSTKEIIEIIAGSLYRKPRIWNVPKGLIKVLTNTGDVLHLPLNNERLQKLTSDYLVSNQKIKTAIGVDRLPVSAKDGLMRTFESFKQ